MANIRRSEVEQKRIYQDVVNLRADNMSMREICRSLKITNKELYNLLKRYDDEC